MTTVSDEKIVRRKFVGQLSDRWKSLQLHPSADRDILWVESGQEAARRLLLPHPSEKLVAAQWLHEPDAAHWQYLMREFRERLEAVRDGAEWTALRELRRTRRHATLRDKQVVRHGHEALSHAMSLLHSGFVAHLRKVSEA